MVLPPLFLALACAEPIGSAEDVGTRARDCQSCHSEIYDAWQGSPHALSGTSTAFQRLQMRAAGAWGSFAGDRCDDCHRPTQIEDQNVSCLICHGAVGNHGTSNGQLALDLTLPLAGAGHAANPAHAVRQSGFLRSAELCGTCHQVEGPGLLDEPTLDEFRAYQTTGGTETCIDCHMRTESGAVDHRFIGPDHASEGRNASIQRLAGALTLALERTTSESGPAVKVTLRNVGAGHAIPTGATALRELYVEVEVDGEQERLLELHSQPVADGEETVLLTDGDRVIHRSLGPGEARSAWVWPSNPDAPVRATLFRRSIRATVRTALDLSAEAPVPVLRAEL